VSAAWPVWPVYALSAAIGAIIGSFLNVCIYRIPREISVVTPPSACPHCGHRIAAYDNVPVLGWLWLGGRCRTCRAPISRRYPVVEAVTALMFLGLTVRCGLTAQLAPALIFGGAMIVVTLIDYDQRIIPDVITIPGTVLGVLASFLTPVTLLEAVVGAGLGFALLWGIAWGYRRATGVDGMGGGDVKLAALLGAFLGWKGLLLTIFLASFAGTIVGIALMAARRGGRRTALPFGTFLAPVGIAVYIWGPDLIRWYTGFLRR
jgi:leader peptidase (prepilin peptidase)/N-methyltransferase